MSDLHLPTVEIVVSDMTRDTTITLDRATLLTSEAPYVLAQVQMTMSLLYAFVDLLKHLSGIATEAAARDIRTEEKRGT